MPHKMLVIKRFFEVASNTSLSGERGSEKKPLFSFMMKKYLVQSTVITWRSIRVFFECFLLFLFLYWLIITVLPRIPVNTAPGPEGTIPVYITSNGVHSDVVVPIRTVQIDWGKELGITSELNRDTMRTFLAFGWGNKRFFLNTKDWGDLTFGTAFGAAFHLGTSAMHLVQEVEPVKGGKDVIALELTVSEYNRLIGFLKGSFIHVQDRYVPIPEHPYGDYNFFFEAKRSYGLSYTCNSWTNDALKVSGQRCCAWTALRDGIYLQYESPQRSKDF